MFNESLHKGAARANGTGQTESRMPLAVFPGVWNKPEQAYESLRAELRKKDALIEHLSHELHHLKRQLAQLNLELERMRKNTPLIIV